MILIVFMRRIKNKVDFTNIAGRIWLAQFAFLCLLLNNGILVAQDFNKRADFNYAFDSNKTHISTIAFNKDMLTLPEFGASYHTALLEVDLKTSPGVRLWQPYIEIEAEGINARQYFDFGAKGRRYLNLSEFVQMDVDKLKINTRHCHLKKDKFRLILYKNIPIEKEQLLVLAPHPDDAEIAAYGLYAENPDAMVVNITIGDAGKKMYDELYTEDTTHYIKKANIRLWNSITVPLLAGLDPENCINLGYFDATLKSMYLNPEQPVKSRYLPINEVNSFRKKNISSFLDTIATEPNWVSLIADLKHILQAKHPTVIVTPYPALDVHPDHKLTTLALLEALQELDYPDVKLYLYTNHFVYSEMYPTGKKGSLISLPPNTSEAPISFEGLYSHTLSDIMQADKVLALEAMNPLRPDTEWHTTRGSWKLFMKIFRENMRNTEQDYYYRRAVRNNELFFIVHSKNIFEKKVVFDAVMGDMNFVNE